MAPKDVQQPSPWMKNWISSPEKSGTQVTFSQQTRGISQTKVGMYDNLLFTFAGCEIIINHHKSSRNEPFSIAMFNNQRKT
jgi:hypothetical protein